MSLPEHLEKFLGTIRGGWSQTADGRRTEFTVVDFAGGSRLHEHAFATLGLSKIPLHSPSHTGHIYQELVIVVPVTLGLVPVPDTLQHVAQEAVATGRAVLRGYVIGPRGPLFYDDSKMEALYAANPWIFPNEFATYREKDRDVSIVWLVPISRGEAEFVRVRGWRQFEDELAKANPDLVDIKREPIFG